MSMMLGFIIAWHAWAWKLVRGLFRCHSLAAVAVRCCVSFNIFTLTYP